MGGGAGLAGLGARCTPSRLFAEISENAETLNPTPLTETKRNAKWKNTLDFIVTQGVRLRALGAHNPKAYALN